MSACVKDTFLYFAYGSNLLKKRIHINNSSATFIGIGRLDEHQLDFMRYSDHWRGASATIVPLKGHHIWGAIWRLHNNDLKTLDCFYFYTLYLKNYRLDFIRYSKFWGGPQATVVPTANAHVWGVIWQVDLDDQIILDNQEGVDIKWYYVKFVEVNTPHMGVFTCRTYIQKVNPLPRGDNDDIPVERWPSQSYKHLPPSCTVSARRTRGRDAYHFQPLQCSNYNPDSLLKKNEKVERDGLKIERFERVASDATMRVPLALNDAPLMTNSKKIRLLTTDACGVAV
ncbi:unnamed protein product, partial [Iphiclides podalirius]